jgi:hypothetical protein
MKPHVKSIYIREGFKPLMRARPGVLIVKKPGVMTPFKSGY